MRYTTIVEKDTSGLEELINAVSQFEEDRFLEGLRMRRYTSYDIQQATLRVREYQAKMNREVLALDKFSETFIQEYATDNNQCFETARRLFNRIRSTISASRRIFRKTCPIVRRQITVGNKGSIWQRSVLSYGGCTRDLFGISSYDEAVQILYEDLRTFFTTVVSTLVLCRKMIMQEMAVREDGGLCLSIYRDSREKALSGIREVAKDFVGIQLPANELAQRKVKAQSMTEFAKKNYHRFERDEFRQFLLFEAIQEGRNDGLTDEETALWPDNHAKALAAREAIKEFDTYGAEGQKGKLDSRIVVEFLKWSGVSKDKEKRLYEQYFCTTYKGRLRKLGWGSICKMRKECEEQRISDAELAESFEKRQRNATSFHINETTVPLRAANF